MRADILPNDKLKTGQRHVLQVEKLAVTLVSKQVNGV